MVGPLLRLLWKKVMTRRPENESQSLNLSGSFVPKQEEHLSHDADDASCGWMFQLLYYYYSTCSLRRCRRLWTYTATCSDANRTVCTVRPIQSNPLQQQQVTADLPVLLVEYVSCISPCLSSTNQSPPIGRENRDWDHPTNPESP